MKYEHTRRSFGLEYECHQENYYDSMKADGWEFVMNYVSEGKLTIMFRKRDTAVEARIEEETKRKCDLIRANHGAVFTFWNKELYCRGQLWMFNDYTAKFGEEFISLESIAELKIARDK